MFLLPALALGAARADSDGAGHAQLILRFAAYSSDAGAVRVGEPGLGVVATVEQVWLALRDLRFRRDCSRPSQRVDVRGPVVAELVGGRTTGLPGRIPLAATRYCRMAATLRAADATTAPGGAELRGVPVLIHGRRTDGVPFVLRSRRIELLSLEAADREGFALKAGGTRLFMAVDLARWMRGLDLAVAEVSHDWRGAVILIDERSNSHLLETFEQRFASGLRLFLDRDGNGVLTPDERGEASALASGAR